MQDFQENCFPSLLFAQGQCDDAIRVQALPEQQSRNLAFSKCKTYLNPDPECVSDIDPSTLCKYMTEKQPSAAWTCTMISYTWKGQKFAVQMLIATIWACCCCSASHFPSCEHATAAYCSCQDDAHCCVAYSVPHNGPTANFWLPYLLCC